MYVFKYFIKGKIFDVCKNVENVKGLNQIRVKMDPLHFVNIFFQKNAIVYYIYVK